MNPKENCEQQNKSQRILKQNRLVDAIKIKKQEDLGLKNMNPNYSFANQKSSTFDKNVQLHKMPSPQMEIQKSINFYHKTQILTQNYNISHQKDTRWDNINLYYLKHYKIQSQFQTDNYVKHQNQVYQHQNEQKITKNNKQLFQNQNISLPYNTEISELNTIEKLKQAEMLNIIANNSEIISYLTDSYCTNLHINRERMKYSPQFYCQPHPRRNIWQNIFGQEQEHEKIVVIVQKKAYSKKHEKFDKQQSNNNKIDLKYQTPFQSSKKCKEGSTAVTQSSMQIPLQDKMRIKHRRIF